MNKTEKVNSLVVNESFTIIKSEAPVYRALCHRIEKKSKKRFYIGHDNEEFVCKRVFDAADTKEKQMYTADEVNKILNKFGLNLKDIITPCYPTEL